MPGVDYALRVPVRGRPDPQRGSWVQDSGAAEEFPGGGGAARVVDERVGQAGGSGRSGRQVGFDRTEWPCADGERIGITHRVDETLTGQMRLDPGGGGGEIAGCCIAAAYASRVIATRNKDRCTESLHEPMTKLIFFLNTQNDVTVRTITNNGGEKAPRR